MLNLAILPSGYGKFLVLYVDAKGIEHKKIIGDTVLIDRIRHNEKPKRTDIRELIKLVTSR